MQLTLAQLRRIATGPTNDSNMASIVAGWTAYGVRSGLDRPHRLAMYIAQLAHESGDFRWDHEIWGPTPAQAAYDTRTDLGNSPAVDGDGKLYMGRTIIQVTGKANYAAFRDWCHGQGFACPDFVVDPEAIDTDPWEGLAPIWFWVTHGLNAIADTGNFQLVTRRINGGLNGEADREALYVRAGLVLLGYGPTDVRKFQQHRNLTPDGVAGPNTLLAIHTALTQLGAGVPPAPVAFIQGPAPVQAVTRTSPEAKAALLAAGSRTIQLGDVQNKLYAVSGTMAVGTSIVASIGNTLAMIPPWGWGLLALAVIAALYLLTHRIMLARIEDALSGAHIGRDIGLVTPAPILALPPPAEEAQQSAADADQEEGEKLELAPGSQAGGAKLEAAPPVVEPASAPADPSPQLEPAAAPLATPPAAPAIPTLSTAG